MRLKVTQTKNAASLYVIKSTYENKVNSSKIVEKLGTYDELKEKLGGKDPYVWARAYIAELNRKEKEGIEPVVIAKYSPSRQLEKGARQSCHGGYLFLQRLFHEFGLHRICQEISQRHKAEYDLSAILSSLVYTRILFPGSKRSSHEISKRFIQEPAFELYQVYRALDLISRYRIRDKKQVMKCACMRSSRLR